MSVELLKLEEGSYEQHKELLKEVNNPDILKYLGHNKPWTLDYIESLKDDLTDYRNWIVLFEGRVSGYIGLRPYVELRQKVGLQVRIFVYPGGKGIGKLALKELEHNTLGIKTYAIVKSDNGPSNGLFKTWKLLRSQNMYGSKHNIYLCDQEDFKKLNHTFYKVGKDNIQITNNKIKCKDTTILMNHNQFNIYKSIPYKNVDKTYCFCGDSGLKMFDFFCLMKGWTRVDTVQNNVFWIREEAGCHNYNQCYIKNKLDGLSDITNKSILPTLLKNRMPETFDIEDIKEIKDIMILKPVGNGAHSGRGISVITNNEEFEEAKKDLNPKWKYVISKYITNPYLYNGLKCHYRVYYLISENKYDLLEQVEVLTAKDPYVQKDWTNKNIHDSHGASTTETYFMNNDKHLEEIKKLGDEIFKIAKPKHYNESKIGYELLGLDVMFDDTDKLWLIEINNRVGLSFLNDKKGYEFNKLYCEWEYKFVQSII